MQLPMITMQKSADVGAPVLDVIEKRKSSRAYSNRPVETEKIDQLFEAARWAPSSVNEQPWAYVYATQAQPELYNKIFDVLNDSNKVWAKNAQLFVLSLARKNFLRNDMPNHSARYDVGAANAFLSLQATQLGLNVHQMGGYNPQQAINNLNIPNNYEPVVIMAIGYPGDVESLPENLKMRELATRERYVQQEFVMNHAF